jgi:cyanophycin synthetase
VAIVLNDFKPEACEECGMGAVHHRLEKFSVRLNSLSRFFFGPFDWFFARLAPLTDRGVNRVMLLATDILFMLGLAVKVNDLGAHHSETTQALWHEAVRRGITMYEVRVLGLSRNHFIARFGKKAWAFQGMPRPMRRQKSILWIDDKAEMKKRFLKAGFPVAAGGLAKNEREALALFHALRAPVIVKPQEGSGGRHTTIHIANERDLKEALESALVVAPRAIIEEELYGPVFRATLIEKKLAAVLRRDPPQVIGNGRSTIRELVLEENKNPLRQGPVFAVIDLDSPASKKELARQGLASERVLPHGAQAFFHFKVNWGVGGTSYDATDAVHPENKKLFEEIGAYLGDDIVGIDFIISDISKSWRETERCGVIELNSLPLIGNHHFPYSGPVKNVAGAVWDMVFPETKKSP